MILSFRFGCVDDTLVADGGIVVEVAMDGESVTSVRVSTVGGGSPV